MYENSTCLLVTSLFIGWPCVFLLRGALVGLQCVIVTFPRQTCTYLLLWFHAHKLLICFLAILHFYSQKRPAEVPLYAEMRRNTMSSH